MQQPLNFPLEQLLQPPQSPFQPLPLLLPTWLASPTHLPSVARMERDKRVNRDMGATTYEELLREDQQEQHPPGGGQPSREQQ